MYGRLELKCVGRDGLSPRRKEAITAEVAVSKWSLRGHRGAEGLLEAAGESPAGLAAFAHGREASLGLRELHDPLQTSFEKRLSLQVPRGDDLGRGRRSRSRRNRELDDGSTWDMLQQPGEKLHGLERPPARSRQCALLPVRNAASPLVDTPPVKCHRDTEQRSPQPLVRGEQHAVPLPPPSPHMPALDRPAQRLHLPPAHPAKTQHGALPGPGPNEERDLPALVLKPRPGALGRRLVPPPAHTGDVLPPQPSPRLHERRRLHPCELIAARRKRPRPLHRLPPHCPFRISSPEARRAPASPPPAPRASDSRSTPTSSPPPLRQAVPPPAAPRAPAPPPRPARRP